MREEKEGEGGRDGGREGGLTDAPGVDHDLVGVVAGLGHGGPETSVGTDDS